MTPEQHVEERKAQYADYAKWVYQRLIYRNIIAFVTIGIWCFMPFVLDAQLIAMGIVLFTAFAWRKVVWIEKDILHALQSNNHFKHRHMKRFAGLGNADIVLCYVFDGLSPKEIGEKVATGEWRRDGTMQRARGE